MRRAELCQHSALPVITMIGVLRGSGFEPFRYGLAHKKRTPAYTNEIALATNAQRSMWLGTQLRVHCAPLSIEKRRARGLLLLPWGVGGSAGATPLGEAMCGGMDVKVVFVNR